jgi:hypothetical protein
MQVKEVLENALYLSVKDRYSNALPSDPTQKATVLEKFLTDFNNVLIGVGKKNPAFSSYSFNTSEVKTEEKLNISYFDLKEAKLLTLFRVEFLYSGGTYSITLQRLGMNDFFSNSNLRTVYTFPAFYNYNLFSSKLYIYPKPSVTGEINVFGKKKIGPFETIDEEMPDFASGTFLLFIQYFFAKFICSQYNVPFQAQKEELLKEYGRLVDSENNISYQEVSVSDGRLALPIRNTRIGL